jgi:glycogen operon protein
MGVILLLSQGTPMLLAGDEFCRTQKGNNNPYCQDNSISWLDWSLAEKHKDMLRFFRLVIRLRKEHPVFRRTDFFASLSKNEPAEIIWQSSKQKIEDWSAENRLLCFLLNGLKAGDPNNFFIALNADIKPHSVELPSSHKKNPWSCIIDTSLPSPKDCDPDNATPLSTAVITVQPMTAVVLIA